MPRARIPSPRAPLAESKTGIIAREWWRFFHDDWRRTGVVEAFEVTVGQGDVVSGGQKILLDALVGEQWKVRGIILSGDGNSFSGGGGDRDMAITDGTTIWSVIPANTLQNLAISRWGIDAGTPDPATASHLFAASASGTDIVAQYSGGSADYSVGAATIMLMAERTA